VFELGKRAHRYASSHGGLPADSVLKARLCHCHVRRVHRD
jgi:hypothetical protein